RINAEGVRGEDVPPEPAVHLPLQVLVPVDGNPGMPQELGPRLLAEPPAGGFAGRGGQPHVDGRCSWTRASSTSVPGCTGARPPSRVRPSLAGHNRDVADPGPEPGGAAAAATAAE